MAPCRQQSGVALQGEWSKSFYRGHPGGLPGGGALGPKTSITTAIQLQQIAREFQGRVGAEVLRQAQLGRCGEPAGFKWMEDRKRSEGRTEFRSCFLVSAPDGLTPGRAAWIPRDKKPAATATQQSNCCRAHTPASCSEGLQLQVTVHLPKSLQGQAPSGDDLVSQSPLRSSQQPALTCGPASVFVPAREAPTALPLSPAGPGLPRYSWRHGGLLLCMGTLECDGLLPL